MRSPSATRRAPFAFRGLDGPIRPSGRGVIEPAGDEIRHRASPRARAPPDTTKSSNTLLPVARSQAAKQVPRDQQRLKEKLEGGGA